MFTKFLFTIMQAGPLLIAKSAISKIKKCVFPYFIITFKINSCLKVNTKIPSTFFEYLNKVSKTTLLNTKLQFFLRPP